MKHDGSRFEVRPVSGKGKGLFARVPLHDGDFLLEYVGRRIPTRETDDLPSRYLFEVDGTEWTVDGDVPENLARFINHACKPNAEAIIEDEHIYIYATRHIAAGEEVTIDYGDEYFAEFIKPVGCKCGARKHRG